MIQLWKKFDTVEGFKAKFIIMTVYKIHIDYKKPKLTNRIILLG